MQLVIKEVTPLYAFPADDTVIATTHGAVVKKK
jgi:hypothetical protein